MTTPERSHAAAAPARLAPTVSFAPARERLDALRAEWAALASTAAEPNPFAEHWFVAASIRNLGDSGVRIAEVREGGLLLGLLPLCVERDYGRIPVSFVQNWRHHHHFLGAPLVAQGSEERFWRAVIEALDGADWARGFLHVRDMAEDGPAHRALQAAAAGLGRPAATVYREERAFLQSSLGPTEYYEQTVRKKKRKELARLRSRLGEMGALATRSFGPGDDLSAWCDAFLQLERAGWKGREGSALACQVSTEHFFREAMAGARDAGRLQLLALELDGRPIAMLINFLTPPGSFSFKTAFDEDYARFSPGVLLQIENLGILADPDVAWMDSCASQDHPMIDSFWAERRAIVRVTIPLGGARRRLAFGAARALEMLSAARRRARPQTNGEQE